jgi:hypothetical protein
LTTSASGSVGCGRELRVVELLDGNVEGVLSGTYELDGHILELVDSTKLASANVAATCG